MGMNNQNRVGLRIRAIRLEQDLTQDQFAEKIDRAIETVSNIERGKSYPSFETIDRIIDVFGISLHEFFDIAESNDDISKKRAQILEEIRAITRQLPDQKLEIAVKQLTALL